MGWQRGKPPRHARIVGAAVGRGRIHTYSHPFDWSFFKNGDADAEIPFLKLYKYKGPVWKPTDPAAAAKMKAPTLSQGFDVPRAFAVERFDLHKEIAGSIAALQPLLPKGKRIEVLAWSGNCVPWEEAVHLTRVAGVQNINGGDTRFDPDYPAYASVAPIGRQVGQERQIYVSSSNENTYTDLWTENFHAFRYLRKTLDNNETPFRLKPFTIYYHMYSGERAASLSALLSNLDYARTQDVIPIKVSKFTHIAEGFYGARFVAMDRDMWRVENRGTLNTIRFDHGALRAVDFKRSEGVIGQRRFQGSLYVSLDPAAKEPVIALRDDDRYYAQPEDSTPYLIESRWEISSLSRSEQKIGFTAQGYGNGEMIWQVSAPGHYRATLQGKSFDGEAGNDRLLKFSLDGDALEPVQVIVTRVGNAPSNRTILYALLLTGGVAGIGIYIAPSPKEIGLMQMNDRDFSEAFKSFSVLHAAGDNSINVASPLINLDIYYGDIDKAIEVLTQYLADHPHSAEGYKRLAELYKSSQRLDHYCAALEILQKLSPSTGNLRDLADTYDFLGRREEEMGALTRLISSKDYNPADEDYIKLATFLHVAGKSDEAVNVIRSYIKDRDYEVGANTASLAVHLLLEEGKIDKAEDIAARYAVRSGDVNAAIALASQFEERRQPDAAYDLLKPFAKDVGKSPELEQQIVNILLAQRKDDEAMAMLKDQYPIGHPTPFACACADRSCHRAKGFHAGGRRPKKSDAAAMPEDALLRYANFAQQTKRQTLAQILRERLGPDYLRLAPLLDAVLMIGVNDTFQLPEDIAGGAAKYMVSSTERLTVASIYLSHGIGGEALAMIKSASLPDMLDILGPADLALFYLEAGQPEDGVRQLVAARDDGTLQMQATIDEALLLLDAGQGHMAEAAKKADAYGDKNSDLFADGHDIAQHYGHNDVATMFALRLYKIAPTLPNRLLVAEALVREGRFGEAQAYLKPPAEKDEGSRRLYLDAVADWVEKAGIKNLPDAQKKEAESFLLSSAQGINLSASDRLGFADLFDDIGLFDQAEKFISRPPTRNLMAATKSANCSASCKIILRPRQGLGRRPRTPCQAAMRRLAG